MSKQTEALKLALAEQPAQQQCRTDGRCQYAIDSGAEGMGHCPKGKCIMPAQQQEPDRVKFERHWRKTRGGKKANRELPRHPLQPQTYIQDSANRHWVTWQAAVRSVSSPSPCPTCEALARTVMLDQTSHDAHRKPLTHEQRVDLLAKFEAHKHEWHAQAILIDMVEAAHGITGEKK